MPVKDGMASVESDGGLRKAAGPPDFGLDGKVGPCMPRVHEVSLRICDSELQQIEQLQNMASTNVSRWALALKMAGKY